MPKDKPERQEKDLLKRGFVLIGKNVPCPQKGWEDAVIAGHDENGERTWWIGGRLYGRPKGYKSDDSKPEWLQRLEKKMERSRA